jgi:hypothetical protein
MSDSFWQLEDGTDLSDSTGEYEIDGGNLEPIPDGTTVLASIEEAKWDNDKEGNIFLSIRWGVTSPNEYKNRKVFQKLWVKDVDPRAKDPVKKRQKAKRMFGAIDKNAGGHLVAAKKEPTNEDLARHLTLKLMLVKIKVWEMTNEQTGEAMKGNWVAAVSPRDKGAVSAAKPSAPTKPAAATAAADDVPF